MLAMLKAAFPVLLRITLSATLVVPTFWLPNVRLVTERLAVAAVPVPVKLTVCGLPAALSKMLTVAVRVPAAVGVNVMLIVQLPPAATELPQVVVSGKSPGLSPVTIKLVMPKRVLPLFVKLTVCAGLLVPTSWLPKVRVEGERPIPGAVPVPVRLSVWGLLAALSVNVTEAVRAPAALGANETVSVHCAEAAREEPQLLLTVKSWGFEPVT
jgi:hypothetical protein